MWNCQIGLEVHAQIRADKKIFSRADGGYSASKEPNTNVDFIDLGIPGALPVLNADALRIAIKTSLALNAAVNDEIHFDRKHYRYPDLPNGFQITQIRKPISYDGYIMLDSGKKIRIRSLHVEQDAAKIIDCNSHDKIDFNRSGVGLMEIVTYPDIANDTEAVEFLHKLKDILVTIDACDCNMEEGSMRCDVNLSIYKDEQEKQTVLPVEIKNINSFKFVKSAITYEINRQIREREKDQIITKQTRRFDQKEKTTIFMRNKAAESEYFYMPEFNLPQVSISEHDIQQIRSTLPMLPEEKCNAIISYGASREQACIVVSNDLYEYTNKIIANIDVKYVSGLLKILTGVFLSVLRRIDNDFYPSVADMSRIAELIAENALSNKDVKNILIDVCENCKDKYDFSAFENQGANNNDVNDTVIEQLISQLVADNKDKVDAYKSGNNRIVSWFVGQVLSKHNLPPNIVFKITKEFLDQQ